MLNINAILEIVREAGNLALSYQKNNQINSVKKADNTPVTEADLAVNKIYLYKLSKIHPEIPIISEENPQDENIKNLTQRFFLIDPIDGTKAFIQKSPDFVSQIALIENGKPIFAAIFNPARDELYYSDNRNSYLIHNKQTQIISVKNNTPPVIYFSNRLKQKKAFKAINKLNYQSTNIPSSYKFCLLAKGEANLIPFLSPVHSWDIAPPDLIIRTAGGICQNLQAQDLTYIDKEFNCENFIAASSKEHFQNCLNAINAI
ncbi:MAG: 3'(2'),5'-bisphosphate nucleotidase CysQ [Rickettsiales bacterium]|nr:3'(2'),5'-bisphosphate nucleotidase CysQ [Rickettsiales bacterium]